MRASPRAARHQSDVDFANVGYHARQVSKATSTARTQGPNRVKYGVGVCDPQNCGHEPQRGQDYTSAAAICSHLSVMRSDDPETVLLQMCDKSGLLSLGRTVV